MHQIHQKQVEASFKSDHDKSKKYNQKSGSVVSTDVRPFRAKEPQMCIVRNKFTKEIVDIEVSLLFKFVFFQTH